MKALHRPATIAVFLAAAIVAPASLFAHGPFDGTWRANLDQSKLSSKPITISLSNGAYDCSTCAPTIQVKADGQDQPVTGQNYDTLSVRAVDAKSIELVTKKNGNVVSYAIRTVSDDGNTLTLNATFHPADGSAAITTKSTYNRVGPAPAGSHATSGSWQVSKVSQSANGLLTTYKTDGDTLTMSTPSGVSYAAKMDGADYPVKGSYNYNSLSLTRVDNHTFQETDKKDAKVIWTGTTTVSPDGKTMTTVGTNSQTGRTSTIVAEKQ
jgi:hypothetical protein